MVGVSRVADPEKAIPSPCNFPFLGILSIVFEKQQDSSGRGHLNNILEQDHRFIKKRIAASLWFRSVDGALNTIAGYESMNMIRKGQVRWLAKGDIVGQMSFVQRLFGIAA